MQVRLVHLRTKDEIDSTLTEVGVDVNWVAYLREKIEFYTVKIDDIRNEAANILKQQMLSLGAEAAVNRQVAAFKPGMSSVLLSGTLRHYKELVKRLSVQPFQLPKLAEKINFLLEEKRKIIRFPGKTVDCTDRVLVMGILNVTPDSFTDGSKYLIPANAVRFAETMFTDGVDIIDVGGESTRPGAVPVSTEEELARVIPVISQLAKKYDIPIAIDTYKSEVARQAIDNGAMMVNDISGLQFDPQMVTLVKEKNVPVIISHIKGTPREMQNNPQYDNVVKEVYTYLENQTNLALSTGIQPESICIDPGIGFGKTVEHNLQLIRNIAEFAGLGYPILLGTSRKSFIGKILGTENYPLPPEERIEGSLATYVWAVLNKVNILRVHDVKETVRVIKIIHHLTKHIT